MARRYGARHMAWVRSFKKRGRKNPRRRRRNPFPMAGVVANPRRRRSRRSYRRNPARRYRRNPSLATMGKSLFRVGGVGLPSLETMAFAGVGFLAPPFIESFVAPYIPASITNNTVGKYAFKAGAVLGTTWIAKKALGPNVARAVAMGGGVYILASAVAEFAPQFLMGGARAVVSGGTPSQVSSYVAPRNVRSYVSARGGQLGLPSGPMFSGKMNDTAQRFRRY